MVAKNMQMLVIAHKNLNDSIFTASSLHAITFVGKIGMYILDKTVSCSRVVILDK